MPYAQPPFIRRVPWQSSEAKPGRRTGTHHGMTAAADLPFRQGAAEDAPIA